MSAFKIKSGSVQGTPEGLGSSGLSGILSLNTLMTARTRR